MATRFRRTMFSIAFGRWNAGGVIPEGWFWLTVPAGLIRLTGGSIHFRENIMPRFICLLLATVSLSAAGCGWQCSCDCMVDNLKGTGYDCDKNEASAICVEGCAAAGGQASTPFCLPDFNQDCKTCSLTPSSAE